MEGPIGELEADEQRLKAAGTTSQEIRKLLGRGEMQGCRIGIRWLVPKLGLLNYLYKDRRKKEGDTHAEATMRQTV